MQRFLLILLVLICSCKPVDAQTTRPAAATDRVLIISIDGLRPDVLLRAEAPTLKAFITQASFTMWAKTTAQSTTLPSHTSMLTGVVPERHTIMWNGDMNFVEPVYPKVPTLFELAKKQGLSTAMVTGKSKFDTLAKPGTIDFIWITPESACKDTEVRDHAVKIIEANKPQVMFVHLPATDSAGHGQGWGSQPQLNAVNVADQCVGAIFDALKAQGVYEQTLIIVSADHGGQGRGHGPDDVRSRTIPWIAAGPGVRKNFDLTQLGKEIDVETFDTFATACYFLGIESTIRLDGKPIVQIFEASELVR